MTNSISIQLNGVSKKFGANWVFKNISATFQSGDSYAVTGPNGSGKSTLLKVIAGIVTPNKGDVKFSAGNALLDVEDFAARLSYCAPYMELPEEMTLNELLAFHTNLRRLTITTQQLIDAVEIDPAKEIRNYSSGMKQRVKLALAFYTQSGIILLDEPTITLDDRWTNWYLTEVQKAAAGNLLIISSNHRPEYSFCNHVLDIGDFKS